MDYKEIPIGHRGLSVNDLRKATELLGGGVWCIVCGPEIYQRLTDAVRSLEGRGLPNMYGLSSSIGLTEVYFIGVKVLVSWNIPSTVVYLVGLEAPPSGMRVGVVAITEIVDAAITA